MYQVTKHGKEIGTGTLTECIEFIATTLSEFHPEMVTAHEAVGAGYCIEQVAA